MTEIETSEQLSVNKSVIAFSTLDYATSVVETCKDFFVLPTLYNAYELNKLMHKGYGALDDNFPNYYLDCNLANKEAEPAYTKDINTLFSFYDKLYAFSENIFDSALLKEVELALPEVERIVTENNSRLDC